MNYQLVLQFPANSLADYDELITLEDELIKALGKSAKVDGHDRGSGEMNIFVHTDEPKRIFEKIRPVVARREMFQNLVAAYREFSAEEYVVLWPVGSDKQFKIT